MPDSELPPDTALWARLQAVSGGLWGGCVYDHAAILDALGDGGTAQPAAAASDMQTDRIPT